MKKYDMSYVAFLDVLGFKDLVNNNNLDELVQIFDTTLTSAIELTKETMKDTKDLIKQTNSLEKVSISSVSDSIILWTKDDSYDSFFQIVLNIMSLLVFTFSNGMPLRGVLSKGPLAVRQNTNQINILGLGLTRAYELERNQQWSGVVLDGKNIDFETVIKDSILLKRNILVEYEVPHKSGSILNMHCINWVALYKTLEMKINFQESFSKHNKKIDNWDVKYKIDNTEKFYEEMIKKTYTNYI